MKNKLNKDNIFEYQGRSKKQYENSAIGAFVSGIGFIISMILIAIFR
tara:strand:- start:81 stop:221 length:141 start_codon:yes stop_codon:yes gene_type:complete